MRTLRVGVIGVGFIGKQHIEAIRRIPGTMVAAVADSNGEMAQRVSEQLGIPQYYTDYHDLIDDPEIDIIHNCTPSSLHFPINMDVLRKGKHIYCEKPLTIDTAEAEQLVVAAEAAGVAVGVNLNYRHNAMVQEMHERLVNGSVGRPLIVHGQYLQDWLLYDTDYDWRMDPALGGSSRAVADIGSHCFDTAQFVMDKKIISVFAKLINVYPVRKRCETDGTFSAGHGKVLEEVPVPSEDAAFIMVKFEDGTPGLFNITQVCAGKKNGLALTISGSEAAMEWEQERPDRLWIGHREKPNETVYADAKYMTGGAKAYASLPNGHAVGWADAFKNAINAFYTAIREDSYSEANQRYTSFETGCQIMKLVDGCLLSNETQKWVDIH